jgi:hypothetical protein
MTPDTTTGQILAVLLAGLVPVVLAGAAWLRSEFTLRQARAEAERARLERELAQQAKEQVQALGAALGVAMDSDGTKEGR